MIDYQKLTGTQIAGFLALGLLVLGLAAFAPLVARWIPPILGVIWSIAVAMVLRRLAQLGRPTFLLRIMALVVGAASLLRILYLARHAA